MMGGSKRQHEPWRILALTDDLRAALNSCTRILGKLQLIDDAPTQPYRRREGSSPNRADSSIPQGVRQTGSLTGAPSKGLSLWGHYSYRVERAQERGDVRELRKLADCATRDYELHIGERPAFQPTHEAAVAELLSSTYTGMPSYRVAWLLGQSEKWVRRQRAVSGHDADRGHKRGT
jgi:hypothetical protein